MCSYGPQRLPKRLLNPRPMGFKNTKDGMLC
ncbi:hypothetical protein FOXYSP1_16862 [Fusarium oxysporum f. sp. phaseoli]